MSTLEQLISARHSTRRFLPTPVPSEILSSALSLAQNAPSNSNIQPWRLTVVTGAPLARLKAALLAAASTGVPQIPPLPASFRHFRSELGAKIYGQGMGIAHHDMEGRAAAVRQNYEFFGAPVAAIVCMHRELGLADALSVGMYLQTLLLALTERGVGTCAEVSVAGYPAVLRSILGLGDELDIFCGVAIGYSDEGFPANSLVVGREEVEKNVRFMGDAYDLVNGEMM